MPRNRGFVVLGTLVVLTASACGSTGVGPGATSSSPMSSSAMLSSATLSSAALSSAASSSGTSGYPTSSPASSVPAAASVPAAVSVPATSTISSARPRTATTAPVIVLDPGHSVTVHSIDKATGVDVSDYENEPEMRDVWAVALRVRAALVAAGYRVVMTKTSLRQKVSLARRAAIANAAHAALALSIHDQAGANGGIGYRAGNNIVYYQSVGTYRATPAGKRIYFTNKTLAATSKKFGAIFAAQRRTVTKTTVRLQGNVGYNLGTRGLAAGDIWIVQLLSKVPWIYNEAGGNSAGRIGLSANDSANYAAALVAAVEHCVPLRTATG